jgi:hypothetical protein
MTADVRILADHSALLAIPAFAPAILVVAVVFWVARRDRRRGDGDGEGDERNDGGVRGEGPRAPHQDGSP